MVSKLHIPYLTPGKRVLLFLAMVLIGLVIHWMILEVGGELSGQNDEDTANGDGNPIAGFLFLFVPMCMAGVIYIPVCLWMLIRTGRRNQLNTPV